MRGRKYTESGTICKGDTRGTAGKVREHGPDMWEARESGPGCVGTRHYMGVTSTGKPSGCKCVKSSGMLEGSPECVGVCGECTVHAGEHKSVRTLWEWYGGCGNVPECAGVPQGQECAGKWKALENHKIQDFRGQQDTGCITASRLCTNQGYSQQLQGLPLLVVHEYKHKCDAEQLIQPCALLPKHVS